MVILLENVPEQVSKEEIAALLETHLPAEEIIPVDPRTWKVDLGNVDREIANYIAEKINGYYWLNHHAQVNAYCPLFQA